MRVEGGDIMTKDQRLMKKIQKDVTSLLDFVGDTYDELEQDVRRLKMKVIAREEQLDLRLEELKDRISAAMPGPKEG
jgi:cell division septum initiation protein DivIVA